MTIPIQVVAHEILRQNKAVKRTTTPLQIIKLAYLAHGWNLAFFGKPLFSDNVVAWRYGPVLPHLYHQVKHFGKNPIDIDLFLDVAKGVDIPKPQQRIIDEVMLVYGEYSGIELSALTHKEGTPWSDTPQSSVIPTEDIKKHFNEIIFDDDDDDGKSA